MKHPDSFAAEPHRLDSAVLAAALDRCGQPIAITSPEGAIEWMNSAFAASLGEGGSRARRQTVRITRSGENWRGEIAGRRPDGAAFSLELAVTPVADSAGGVTHFIAAGPHAGERRAAEQARELAFRSRIARAFLTAPPEGLYGEVMQVVLESLQSRHGIFAYLDERGRLVAPSPTRDVWDQCGVPGKTIVFPPESWSGAVTEPLTTGKPVLSNTPFRVPEGHIPILRLLSVPIVSRGKPIGLLAVANRESDYGVEDLAWLESIAGFIAPVLDARLEAEKQEQRRRASEEELRRSRENLQHAQRIASLGSWEVDLRTRKTTWSGELCRILGLTPGESTPGRLAFMSTVHPEDRARVAVLVEEALRSGCWRPFEHRIVRPDGSERYVREHAEVIVSEFGDPVAIVGILQDITEYKRLEEQFHQAQKLEGIGRLAGGVAHDFNNLLTVINGYSDLLLSELNPMDPVHGHVAEIRAAGERAADLTRRLLAFSRKQISEPKPLNLNSLIGEAGRMLGRMVGENIEIATKLAPDPGFVLADAGQMNQVLLNLVVNARDAMQGGGRILIETEIVEIREPLVAGHPEARRGEFVRLSISDTGAGMDAEVQSHIFEPFFTTKPEGAGTGLGLASVYGIVKQSDGWIEVESEPGKGSTFRIYLPRVRRDPAPLEALRPAAAAEPGSETILVVEDQAGVRRLACDVLKNAGYEVIEAGSGDEALALVQRHTGAIDLMLTDVMMPGITGTQLAARLASLRPGMKVLFTSGHSPEVIAELGVSEGGAGYLPKPFTPSELAARVRQALGAGTRARSILVVDDEEAIRRLLRQMLEPAGYRVFEASNGAEALQQVEALPVDLVITDLAMPGTESIDTVRGLHEKHPEVKVVAMSEAFGGRLLRTAELLGAHATLSKPLRSEQVLTTIQALLSR